MERGRRRDRGAPRARPAGARRHDLGRGLRAALPAADAQGHQAHGAQRQARVRRARGRDDRRGRRPRLGHDRHQHGRPRRRHQARRQLRAPGAARGRQARAQARRSRLRRALPEGAADDRCSASRVCAAEVLEAGGLFILGTERHESRRIDNQLRGRSGRQGDPGESRFFLSAQDDLVRLFAGERIYKILDKLGSTDDEGNEEPIEAGMLSKQIEKAQKKVEEQHFLHAQAHARVRRRPQPAARGDLHLPRRDPRGPRHERRRARGADEPDRAPGRGVHRRRLRRGLGRRGPRPPRRGDLHPQRRARRDRPHIASIARS